MLQKINLSNLQAIVDSQGQDPITNLLRVDLLLKQQLEERISWRMSRHKDPFFIDFWLMMEWITLEYQRLIPGLTERLYKETMLGLNTLEPVMDYLTRYHTLGFNPDVKLDLEAHIGYYQFYLERLRPYLWEPIAELCPDLGMSLPEAQPAF